MRILDCDQNKSLKNVMLYLRLEEAKELLDDLTRIIENKDEHVHINDSSFEHEVTVVIYKEDCIGMFDDRSKRLIQFDE